MTIHPADLVVGIVALSGGKLVGRTRLQKTAYLLDRCGVRSGLVFDYLYYGPYSEELSLGWAVAHLKGELHVDEQPGRYKVPYTIFETSLQEPETVGKLDRAKAKHFLERMKSYSDVVLELAATLVYLRDNGYGQKAEDELRARKPLKASTDRLALAKKLLSELRLSTSKVGRANPRHAAVG